MKFLSLLILSFFSFSSQLTFSSEIPTSALEMNSSREVLNRVNHERNKRKLPLLCLKQSLSEVSFRHAKDMSIHKYFSHVSRDGRTMSDRLAEKNIRYRAAGENIASGQKTADKVMLAWMNSPKHKKNILNSKYRCMGIGRSENIWVQNFID